MNNFELISAYTESISKLWNLTRKRPEFGPGAAGAEAAQLEKVERCRRAPKTVAADDVKTAILNCFQYILKTFQYNTTESA